MILEQESPMMNACQPNGPYVLTISNATEISPPNDPENPGFYQNNLNCTWKIVTARGKRIRLDVEGNQNFEIEEKYKSWSICNILSHINI